MTEQRPRRNSPEVMNVFYEKMAEMVRTDSDMAAGMSIERIVDGLKCAGAPNNYDGYQYAKHLEDHGWSGITAHDIEMLDCASHIASEATHNAEIAWVKRNNITPPIESGATVRANIYRVQKGAKKLGLCMVEGKAYLNERNSAAGYCLFRDSKWIEEHGDQGGTLIPWESLENI